MNSFVKYIGDNYGEVLDFVTSYVHSDGKNVKLYIIIPFEGDIEVRKGDYILKQGNKISIRHDI